ncbi:MAG: hypothetical protein ILP12_04505 [Lachnospiraceae bacterium]|nr:hypothetical protein [Lachnospiraceae bacterium]
MDTEKLTVRKVLEIFSDLLDNTEEYEVVQTRKMGLVLISDSSRNYDRSNMMVEQINDAESLARELLYSEIAKTYNLIDHGQPDSYDCDEAVVLKVRELLKPRTDRLSLNVEEEFDAFFKDPCASLK